MQSDMSEPFFNSFMKTKEILVNCMHIYNIHTVGRTDHRWANIKANKYLLAGVLFHRCHLYL